MQKLFVHEVPKNLHVHAFINNRKPINTDELLMNFSKSIQPNKPAQPSVRLQAVSGNQYAGIKITDDQKLQKCHIHLSIIRRPPLAAAFMRPASLSRSWSVVLNAWHRGILERQWWQQKKAGTKSSDGLPNACKIRHCCSSQRRWSRWRHPTVDCHNILRVMGLIRGLNSRSSDPALNLLNKLFAPAGTAVVLKD